MEDEEEEKERPTTQARKEEDKGVWDIFDERGNIDFRKVKEMKKRGIPPLKPVNHA